MRIYISLEYLSVKENKNKKNNLVLQRNDRVDSLSINYRTRARRPKVLLVIASANMDVKLYTYETVRLSSTQSFSEHQSKALSSVFSKHRRSKSD